MKKMSLSLMKGASKITGGRVPVTEWNTILQTYPNVLNGPEGMKQLARIVKVFNDDEIQRAQIERSLRDANGGYLPKDFDTHVDQAMKPFRAASGNKLKGIINGLKQNAQIGEDFDELPPANSYPPDSAFEKNGRMYITDGNKYTVMSKKEYDALQTR
jgi:hypothetical protein